MKPFRISTSINWARESYQRNILAFIALAAIVTILQFGQQLATDPISESFNLCLNAEVWPRTVQVLTHRPWKIVSQSNSQPWY